ncbi:MAG: hypothetical protein E6J43_02715 [Chloroflexi bacterium]|nr:MAG: hypothetical protein E6J43_02715 [Chloroflexota bacterium]
MSKPTEPESLTTLRTSALRAVLGKADLTAENNHIKDCLQALKDQGADPQPIYEQAAYIRRKAHPEWPPAPDFNSLQKPQKASSPA